MEQNHDPNQKQLLSVKEVSKITGFSTSSIYKYCKAGNFPKPKKIGRSTRWVLAEVMNFIQTA